MEMTSMVVSIIFTVIVLILSVLTITKGYGYKHTVDPPPEKEDVHENERQDS